MCRLLAYIGEPIQGDRLLLQPEHSLEVQSYRPKEMTAGLLNADGFGVGWYHPKKDDLPYTYKSLLPIWSDVNLPQISRYLESHCVLAYVRSATPGLPVDLGNCQPFVEQKISFVHNGYINNFRQTLYRPIRAYLNDYLYQNVHGTTDSEHIFALILNHYKNDFGVVEQFLVHSRVGFDLTLVTIKDGSRATWVDDFSVPYHKQSLGSGILFG